MSGAMVFSIQKLFLKAFPTSLDEILSMAVEIQAWPFQPLE